MAISPELEAKILRYFHGLLAHWAKIADAEWLESLIRWEEDERARRGLES